MQRQRLAPIPFGGYSPFSSLTDPILSDPSSADGTDSRSDVCDPTVSAESSTFPLMLSRNVADGKKEQTACHRAAEIEQPVIIPVRAAGEHILEHRLRDARSAAVTDEVGPESVGNGAA